MTTNRPQFSLRSLLLFVAAAAALLGGLAWHWRTLRQAQAIAELERQRAEESLHKSRAAVDQMLAAVAQNELQRIPTIDVHRGQLFEQARAAINQVTAENDTAIERIVKSPSKPERSELYKRIKAEVDALPAIDTHDHLWPFDELPGYVETDRGRGMNLSSIWRNSYYTWINPITPWKPGGSFDEWWGKAKHDFDNARATSFYRYQLPAFQDLYGIDFERITDDEAHRLNDRIFENYRDQKWLYHVVTERANIELMFNDPYWARFEFKQSYPWEVIVFNVTTLVRGFHPSEFTKPADDPYHFARAHDLQIESLDDYLVVLDRLFQTAKQHGAVCLKSTLAYQRTLDFANVSAERAVRVFGRATSELSPAEIKDFEDCNSLAE